MKKYTTLFVLPLLLVGCKSNIQVTKEDAVEISLDAAGYTESEVSDLNVTEGDGYTVVFKSEGGEYEYQVKTDGIISKRSVTSYSSLDDEDVIEKTDENEEVIEEDEEDKKEEKIDKDTEEKVVQAALNNLALTLNQVQDVEVTLEDDGTYLVELMVISNRNVFKTNVDENFRVLSAVLTETRPN